MHSLARKNSCLLIPMWLLWSWSSACWCTISGTCLFDDSLPFIATLSITDRLSQCPVWTYVLYHSSHISYEVFLQSLLVSSFCLAFISSINIHVGLSILVLITPLQTFMPIIYIFCLYVLIVFYRYTCLHSGSHISVIARENLLRQFKMPEKACMSFFHIGGDISVTALRLWVSCLYPVPTKCFTKYVLVYLKWHLSVSFLQI